MMPMRSLLLSLACLAAASGCAAPAKPGDGPADTAGGGTTMNSAASTGGGGDGEPRDVVRSRDAAPAVQKVFQIEFYQLAVTRGTISANETFWKPFDETFLGLWQHDVLAKNGLRVGKAPIVELKYLEDQLVEAEQTRQSMIGQAGQDVEIPVRQSIDRQTLFYFDRDGNSEGRDFERIDNAFAISFRQTPRRPDHVRLSIAPLVRDQQSRLEVADPLTMAIRRVQPQTLYELGITLDLGVDECLVIAPTEAAASNAMLVGRAFLFDERPAQLVEKALVIIPRVRGTIMEITPTAQADGGRR